MHVCSFVPPADPHAAFIFLPGVGNAKNFDGSR